jgi:hypothetical protein
LLHFQEAEGKDKSGKPQRELRIHRVVGQHYRKPDGREAVLLHDHASAPVPPLFDEHTLTLLIENHRLKSVSLGKLPEFKDLVKREFATKFGPELHQGEIGLYVGGTTIDYRDAAFRILQK